MGKRMIGVISDTHGLIRPEVFRAFKGCELVIHAGDIGSEEVIRKLSSIAPVIAVRGNTDRGRYANNYNNTEVTEFADISIYVLHDLSMLSIDPISAGYQVIISGHTHKPYQEIRDGVIYLNPGSAGSKRFDLPIHVSILEIDESNTIQDKVFIRNINLLNL